MRTAVLTPPSAGHAHSPSESAPAGQLPPYLQQRGLHYLILGSFLVLTVPLCVLAATSNQYLQPGSVGWFYLCALGTTHFVLTFTIYLQSTNLAYFSSSWKRRLLYFLVPVLIFLAFDLYRALQLALLLPALDVAVRCVIHLLDFNHFNRQSFGVFQLFKGGSKAFPSWVRKVENYYFLCLTVLLFLSFVTGGRFDPDFFGTRLALVPAGACLVALLVGYAVAWRRAPRCSTLVAPLAYFALQSASAILAIGNVSFYVFCLAMHYVEYHALMYPRCFHQPLDAERRIDRCFAVLRRNRLVFYTGLVALAMVLSLCTWIGMGALIDREGGSTSASYLVLISLFDGIFVFHYFIESLIWKFSDPHFRQTLGPLYFKPRPEPGA